MHHRSRPISKTASKKWVPSFDRLSLAHYGIKQHSFNLIHYYYVCFFLSSFFPTHRLHSRVVAMILPCDLVIMVVVVPAAVRQQKPHSLRWFKPRLHQYVPYIDESRFGAQASGTLESRFTPQPTCADGS